MEKLKIGAMSGDLAAVKLLDKMREYFTPIETGNGLYAIFPAEISVDKWIEREEKLNTIARPPEDI